MDALAECKDAGPLSFRNADEFKELAASFEKLRSCMKQKGLLK